MKFGIFRLPVHAVHAHQNENIVPPASPDPEPAMAAEATAARPAGDLR